VCRRTLISRRKSTVMPAASSKACCAPVVEWMALMITRIASSRGLRAPSAPGMGAAYDQNTPRACTQTKGVSTKERDKVRVVYTPTTGPGRRTFTLGVCMFSRPVRSRARMRSVTRAASVSAKTHTHKKK